VFMQRRAREPAVERGGNNLTGFKDVHLKNDSSQGQNLTLTVLCVPSTVPAQTHKPCRTACVGVQGNLAHNKLPRHRTLQWDYS